MRSALLTLCAAIVWLAPPHPAARADQPQPPFFFIQLSDPQFGMFSENRNFVQETINFELAIATVNRLRPAFVVVTGDLVNKPGDPDQIREYRRIASTLVPGIPLYNVAGNHDVGNVPTGESIAAYVNAFGPDHYTFRYGGLTAIVLNSSLIHSPQAAPEQAAAQQRWLETELPRARAGGARPLVIVQHHPWFLESSSEPDQYFNIPLERRTPLLAMFHQAGVEYLVAGHYHRNALARDGGIEMITTGPVGKPLGGARSGLRVFTVRNGAIAHRYYAFGEIPDRIDW